MLKRVVEQMETRSPTLFGFESGGVATFADYHLHAEASRHEQGFVAELLRSASGIDHVDAFGDTPIAAAENVEGDATLLQHFAEHNHKWRFAGTVHADVADGDDWSA